MNIFEEKKLLTFDIETTGVIPYVFRLGKQEIRFDQLLPGFEVPDIMCIGYQWGVGSDPVKILTWDKNQDSSSMIEEFDEILAQADIVVGHNHEGFDIKQINTQRMLHKLPPRPELRNVSKFDTWKQMCKHFHFPCNKLDYASSTWMQLGGKRSTNIKDWIYIHLQLPGWEEKWANMLAYCQKDVSDTRALFLEIVDYCDITIKANIASGTAFSCIHCGSTNLVKRGTSYSATSKFQEYNCKSCRQYAGRVPISNTTGKEGKVMK